MQCRIALSARRTIALPAHLSDASRLRAPLPCRQGLGTAVPHQERSGIGEGLPWQAPSDFLLHLNTGALSFNDIVIIAVRNLTVLLHVLLLPREPGKRPARPATCQRVGISRRLPWPMAAWTPGATTRSGLPAGNAGAGRTWRRNSQGCRRFLPGGLRPQPGAFQP